MAGAYPFSILLPGRKHWLILITECSELPNQTGIAVTGDNHLLTFDSLREAEDFSRARQWNVRERANDVWDGQVDLEKVQTWISGQNANIKPEELNKAWELYMEVVLTYDELPTEVIEFTDPCGERESIGELLMDNFYQRQPIERWAPFRQAFAELNKYFMAHLA